MEPAYSLLASGNALSKLLVSSQSVIAPRSHPTGAAARRTTRPAATLAYSGIATGRPRMRIRTPNNRHRLGRRAPPRERASALRERSDNRARTSCVFSPPRTAGPLPCERPHRTGRPPPRRRIRTNIILVPNNVGKGFCECGPAGRVPRPAMADAEAQAGLAGVQAQAGYERDAIVGSSPVVPDSR
jgi:hypothetical protein